MTNPIRGPHGAIWTGAGAPGTLGNPIGGGPKKPGIVAGLLGGRKGGTKSNTPFGGGTRINPADLMRKPSQPVRYTAGVHTAPTGGIPPQQYAQQRLAQLSNLLPGGLPQLQHGPPGLQQEQTAPQQWRALSPLMGAMLAAQQGHAQQYQIPHNIDPRILALVQHILGGSQGNFEPGGQYGPQPPSSIRYGSAFGDQSRPFSP